MNYSRNDIIKLANSSISKIKVSLEDKVIELEKEFSNILQCELSSAHENVNDVLNILVKHFNLDKNLNIFLIGNSSSKLKKSLDSSLVTCEIINLEEYLKFDFSLENNNYLIIHDYEKLGLSEVEKIVSVAKKNNIPTIEYFTNKDMIELMIGTEADHFPCHISDFSIFEIFPYSVSKFFGNGIILNSKKHNISFDLLKRSKLSIFKAALTFQLFEDQEKRQNNTIDPDSAIKLLVFYDEEGWAWWHRSNNLKKYLSPEILVDIKQVGMSFNESDYDFILLYDAYLLGSIKGIPSHKLIIANSCPKLFHETYNVLKNNLAVAAFTNNYDTYLLANGDKKFYCCQNGVDIDLFYPTDELPKEFKACWVGNSRSMGNKGLGIIELACKKAGVELLIVDAAELKKVSDAESHEWVRDNIYHQASVYICASEFEGTPNPALESLACGIPVISTRVGNMTEIISDNVNGFLVERNAESISKAINKLKSSDLSSFRMNARLSVENDWSWSIKSENYKNMILSLKSGQMFSEENILVEDTTTEYQDFTGSKTAIECLNKFMDKLPSL